MMTAILQARPAAVSLLALTALWACAADEATHAVPVSPSPPATSVDATVPSSPVQPASAGPVAPASGPAKPSVTQVDAGSGTCQQISIDSGRVIPDVLIVLDRSTSMIGFGVDRWTPSVAAIKSITRELDKVIRFGLMAFPGRGTAGGGLAGAFGGGMSCAAGTLEVPLGMGMAGAIASSLDGLELVQSTPTAATLEAAHQVLGAGAAVLDGTSAAKIVVLVTDGGPNCSDDPLGALLGVDTAAVTASVNAITAMQKKSIKTFVLGYDTQSDPALKGVLDQMAQAGGTGDKEHRPIENEASLVMQLRSIIGAAVSCQFTLSTAPTDPNYVSVTIDANKLKLDAPDGFVLSPDRKTLTLHGASCSQVQSEGERHLVTVRVECERQTPLL